MWVLGVNCKLHDSSAALVDGEGRIWAMAEEERFTRVKHAEGTFPAHTARFPLDTAGITWRDIDVVAMGWDMPRFRTWHDSERQEMYAALLDPETASGKGPELVFAEHHLAHALSAFHASGFDKAGVLVVDGSGEFESASIAERRPRGHPPRAGGGHRGRRRTDLPEHRAGLPRARKPPGRDGQVVAARDTEQ
ncbi:hypothetical protein OG568_58200 (plasmid) [Streptomyces sp. NBC_01450]|uniref:carbamoyltransferase N-terminal domain-containing protein n=1 Tax=Streptomyces sp. NBC_01450 TaxID=2903871 RepID=UPI002E373914|nr:carbamoyltransferase N-terminal domain-containing protein [Streptomyces sp. NBC_01450]